MSDPRDDGRRVPPPSPGAAARRELWQPGRNDEEEAEQLGTTRALARPADPRVTTALGVDPETAEPAARLPAVLVLVQWLYLAVERLVEGVNAIRAALARKPEKPDWAGGLDGVLERLERSVAERASAEALRQLGGDLRTVRDSVAEVARGATARTSGPPPAPQPRELPVEVREALGRIDAALSTLASADTVQRVPQRLEAVERKLGVVEQRMPDEGSLRLLSQAIEAVKAAVGRIEAAQRPASEATVLLSAVRWRQRLRWFAVRMPLALVGGIVIGCLVLVVAHFLQSGKVAQPALQPDLASEIQALRDSTLALRAANAALAAKVEKTVRCGHEECPRSALNPETGNWDRTQCRWVVEQCPDLPRQAP